MHENVRICSKRRETRRENKMSDFDISENEFEQEAACIGNNEIQERKKKSIQAKGKKQSAKETKEWSDEETGVLIDMLEANPCLWDVFHSEYTKRDVKEIAYTAIADTLDATVALVKVKINNLRAQLGRERAKELKTKSGQSTDELYTSSWGYYDRLSFLLPVIGSTKSKDTLKRESLAEDGHNELETTIPSAPKKKSIAEKKLDLLTKCTEAIKSSNTNIKKAIDQSETKVFDFSMYIEEKLSLLSKRSRKIAEKRISDILFDIEMSEDRIETSVNTNNQAAYGNFSSSTYMNLTPPIGGQSYVASNGFMDMLNKS